jgi:hypothetical protein
MAGGGIWTKECGGRRFVGGCGGRRCVEGGRMWKESLSLPLPPSFPYSFSVPLSLPTGSARSDHMRTDDVQSPQGRPQHA